MSIPQVLITLAPNGDLMIELPGKAGTRRKCEIKQQDNENYNLRDTLRRMLHAQLNNKVAIGDDGAPTQAQVRHWERHFPFGDDTCAFCIRGKLTKPKKLTQAQRLDTEIRSLDRKGASDHMYRALLSVRQAPLAKKGAASRPETWRDRAVTLRDKLKRAEAGVIMIANHKGVVINRLPPKGANKRAKGPKPTINLSELGTLD
jgi:hypothetical protein